MRHLTFEQAETNLRLGKALEQWLERKPNQEGIVLRWVRLDRESDAFQDEYRDIAAELSKRTDTPTGKLR